jgi:hypothetical protein
MLRLNTDVFVGSMRLTQVYVFGKTVAVGAV